MTTIKIVITGEQDQKRLIASECAAKKRGKRQITDLQAAYAKKYGIDMSSLPHTAACQDCREELHTYLSIAVERCTICQHHREVVFLKTIENDCICRICPHEAKVSGLRIKRNCTVCYRKIPKKLAPSDMYVGSGLADAQTSQWQESTVRYTIGYWDNADYGNKHEPEIRPPHQLIKDPDFGINKEYTRNLPPIEPWLLKAIKARQKFKHTDEDFDEEIGDDVDRANRGTAEGGLPGQKLNPKETGSGLPMKLHKFTHKEFINQKYRVCIAPPSYPYMIGSGLPGDMTPIRRYKVTVLAGKKWKSVNRPRQGIERNREPIPWQAEQRIIDLYTRPRGGYVWRTLDMLEEVVINGKEQKRPVPRPSFSPCNPAKDTRPGKEPVAVSEQECRGCPYSRMVSIADHIKVHKHDIGSAWTIAEDNRVSSLLIKMAVAGEIEEFPLRFPWETDMPLIGEDLVRHNQMYRKGVKPLGLAKVRKSHRLAQGKAKEIVLRHGRTDSPVEMIRLTHVHRAFIKAFRNPKSGLVSKGNIPEESLVTLASDRAKILELAELPGISRETWRSLLSRYIREAQEGEQLRQLEEMVEEYIAEMEREPCDGLTDDTGFFDPKPVKQTRVRRKKPLRKSG